MACETSRGFVSGAFVCLLGACVYIVSLADVFLSCLLFCELLVCMYICMVIEHLFVCVSIVQVFGMVLFLPDVFAKSFCECPLEVFVSCVLVADSAVACFHACPSPSLPPSTAVEVSE